MKTTDFNDLQRGDMEFQVECGYCGYTQEDWVVSDDEYFHEFGQKPVFLCPQCGCGRVCEPVE
jgi:hypothetical protein